ncbi:MAG TPA: methionyl-tRNA formyltransferase [Patescibacteria group bacterium]|nr:methionyl-tRNA formyltransferase [Patescibacteria group bacterium]
MDIVFFGSSSYVLPLLETLNSQFHLKLVVTTEKNPHEPIIKFCQENTISCVSTTTLATDEIQSTLRDQQANVAVLASFGLIIPQEVIDIFPKGIVNLHPSFLPNYRGSTPIQAAIRNGDKETAVSIMLLDQEVDHGPLLAQVPLEISEEDTSESLYKKAFAIGADKLIDILPSYVAGNLSLRPQDHSKATFTTPLTRDSGHIDATNPPANLSYLVRAYYPWPGVWTTMNLFGKEKKVKLLPKGMLLVEGKKPMSKKDFINGYPQTKKVVEQLDF